jgi:hypothetical protein
MAVVNVWPTLPEAVRRQVVAMVEAAAGDLREGGK